MFKASEQSKTTYPIMKFPKEPKNYTSAAPQRAATRSVIRIDKQCQNYVCFFVLNFAPKLYVHYVSLDEKSTVSLTRSKYVSSLFNTSCILEINMTVNIYNL